MVEIYSTVDLLKARLIKSLLGDNGIKCILADENMALIYGTSIPFGGIKILVEESEEEKARMLISSIKPLPDKE
ncbi:hypothetical protein ES703_48992 [subsurface metagenome]